MDSLIGTVATYFTAFGKTLGICQSEAMLFTSVVICLLFLFRCKARERRASCVVTFIWSFCSLFHLPGCQLGAAFDIFSTLNFPLAV